MFGWIGRKTKKLANSAARKADAPLMKRMYLFVKDLYKAIFKRDKGPTETFEEAVTRFKLTPEDLAARKRMFQIQMIIYAAASIAVGFYTYYLIQSGHWISIFFSLVLLVYLILSALKSHFWIFQLKQRKLGCTLQEWLNASIKESN